MDRSPVRERAPQQRPATSKRLLDEGAPILVYARPDAFTCSLLATSQINASEFEAEILGGVAVEFRRQDADETNLSA
jgi:hypothetical protein